MHVQLFPVRNAWNRDHEVPTCIAYQSFDLALIVALGRTTELIRKQIVALQLGERSRSLPLFAAQYPGNGDLRVVVENPCRNGAEVCEGTHMAFEERLSGLGRKRHD